MKIRVVSTKEEMAEVIPNEKIVHLAFRPSSMDIFTICEMCPKLEALQLPKSYKTTLAKSILMFLEMKSIILLEGDVWGHRKDLCEHYIISKDVIDRITVLRQKGNSIEEIIRTAKKEFKLNEDMTIYILRMVKV
jgi:hypothetical protein